MIADILPQDSNVYDVAIVLILSVMGFAQLKLKTAQNEAKYRANRAEVKAEATQMALPDHLQEKALDHEAKLLEERLDENGKTKHLV